MTALQNTTITCHSLSVQEELPEPSACTTTTYLALVSSTNTAHCWKPQVIISGTNGLLKLYKCTPCMHDIGAASKPNLQTSITNQLKKGQMAFWTIC